jgi:inhibitor of cysteine peptidase
MKKPLIIAVFLCLLLGLVGIASGCSWVWPPYAHSSSMKRFQSAEEFINAFRNDWPEWGYMEGSAAPLFNSTMESAGDSLKGVQHSTTNIQVAGVDEADVVKTDGDFIYAITGNSICLVAAYPTEDMRLVSRIEFEDNVNPSEMFVNGNRLVIIGNSYPEYQDFPREDAEYLPQELVFIKIYDVSERNNPELLKTIEHEGYYNTARMIDGNIYVVLASYPRYVIYEETDFQPNEIIPLYRTVIADEEPGAFEPACDWSEVEYVNPEGCSSFLSILSMSLEDNCSSIEKREIAGNSENVYASYENLYIVAADYGYYLNPEESGADNMVQTTIYKFRLDRAAVRYLASGEVPGTVLNQFSMDESKGYFRIATTTGHVTREGSGSTNNVYILDAALNITGSLEGLAEGETIYSARFVGDRAYLVTFKKVDPFFVLDLSNPSHPEVLGALKIPGYSDYLHPYDENHIIGVGKNTVEADPAEGDFAWYQGIKVALFDVSNVSDPKEMYKIEIGDRGTDSYALHDHKAFLFDRDKNLLVLPVLLAELTPEQKESGSARGFDSGQITYQGAYVYDISLRGGFRLGGRITHVDSSQDLTDSDYYYDSDSFVERSLYIENTLYTISRAKVKANSLIDLAEQASVNLE